ncbi:MAG TPA: hydrogenase maturation protease [Pseudoneobacillus sp.]|nr:hydrogenase maturation protease [Pseudoneobacillus sp.]
MEKIIVLGIGNQLMMDDGIGIYLVNELGKHPSAPNIFYLVGESDIDYCLELIDGATFIMIVDAVLSGKEPGELSVFSLEELHESQPLHISPHNLHLFQELYQQKETIAGYLIGIEPFELRFHIGLSDELIAKWDVVLKDVQRTIDELLAKRMIERLEK